MDTMPRGWKIERAVAIVEEMHNTTRGWHEFTDSVLDQLRAELGTTKRKSEWSDDE